MTAGIFLRSVRQVQAYLIDDLRIDEGMLGKLDQQEISSWIRDAPKKSSLHMLVKTLSTL